MSFTRGRIRALLCLAAILCTLLPVSTDAGTYDGIVVFGDSLSDDGNLFALTGGALPPSPPYGNGRFSNGPVWNEYLAAGLGLPLTNLAFGGAFTGHGNHLIGPAGPGLLDEVALFASLHPSGADPSSLYAVWAGANDFFDAPSPSTIGPAVTNLVTAVGTLAGLGATHILVFNMPDLGKTPDGLSSGFSVELTALTLAFDGALDSTLSGLGLPGLTEFDTFGAVHQIIADPGAFGLTDVTTACLNLSPFSVCADPDQHLFWDSVHPTTRVHSILAADVASAIPAPPTVVLLGAGLIAATVAGRRRRRSHSQERP